MVLYNMWISDNNNVGIFQPCVAFDSIAFVHEILKLKEDDRIS